MMKQLIITHFLLNLYLLALVQPALPILEYLINYDYIVNELCENKDKPVMACNGKCYLGDQVDKQLDLDKEHQSPMPPAVDFDKFISLTDNIASELPAKEEALVLRPTAVKNLKELLFATTLLRPPIV
jgi:hypothetical protein